MSKEPPEPPKKIPTRGGGEYDVFSGWRKMLCYTSRPGVCKEMKQSYNRRFRKLVKTILRGGSNEQRDP